MSEIDVSFVRQTNVSANNDLLRVAICDDHAEVLTTVKNMLEDKLFLAKCEVAAFTESDAFLAHVLNHQTDIAVIDIVLDKDTNGIVLAKQINRTCRNTVVIFISGYTKFTEEVYEAEHLYFLKKPINNEKLLAVIQKAIQKLYGKYIVIRQRGSTQRICTDDIIMAESDNRDVNIYLCNDVMIERVAKLSELEKLLPPDIFLRCHKSYIVNMDKISEVKSRIIYLTDGLSAPISRRYADNVKLTITKKLGGVL